MSEPGGDNLFIRDLTPDIDEDTVRLIFSGYAEIKSIRVLPTHIPGGRLSALVQVGSAAEAQWMIENLNGNIPQGLASPVQVQLAESREDKAQRQLRAGAAWGKGDQTAKGGGKGRSSPYPAKGGWDGAWGSWGGGADWGAPAWAAKGGWGWDGGFGGGCKGGCQGKGKAKGKGKGKDGGLGVHALLEQLEALGAIPNKKVAAENGILYVRGLPPDTSDLEMYRMFSPFGPLSSAHAMRGEDGACKGYGFVNFTSPAGATAAIAALSGTSLPDGTALLVRPKDPPKAADAWGQASGGACAAAGAPAGAAALVDQQLLQQMELVQQLQQAW